MSSGDWLTAWQNLRLGSLLAICSDVVQMAAVAAWVLACPLLRWRMSVPIDDTRAAEADRVYDSRAKPQDAGFSKRRRPRVLLRMPARDWLLARMRPAGLDASDVLQSDSLHSKDGSRRRCSDPYRIVGIAKVTPGVPYADCLTDWSLEASILYEFFMLPHRCLFI